MKNICIYLIHLCLQSSIFLWHKIKEKKPESGGYNFNLGNTASGDEKFIIIAIFADIEKCKYCRKGM